MRHRHIYAGSDIGIPRAVLSRSNQAPKFRAELFRLRVCTVLGCGDSAERAIRHVSLRLPALTDRSLQVSRVSRTQHVTAQQMSGACDSFSLGCCDVAACIGFSAQWPTSASSLLPCRKARP
jgi:hypothetical protein